MRGSIGRWVSDRRLRPSTTASSSTPRIPRAFDLEGGPEFGLGTAALLRDRLERQEHGAVGKIGPRHDVFDAIQDHPPGGVEQDLVLVGVELAHGETTASREPAERAGDPRWEARDVVEDGRRYSPRRRIPGCYKRPRKREMTSFGSKLGSKGSRQCLKKSEMLLIIK
jgi:hypothetical protein